MRKVKDAVDLTTKEKIYFKSHAKATYLSDGRNVEEGISDKQDTIADLETIRSGAEKGATAIQEVKTINNQSIVGSGNIEITGGSGSLTAEEVASTEPTPAFPQVLYTAQSLTEEQKSQARTNIGVDDAIESAIAELPEPESSVFKAVFGETSFAEIREAYDNGKVIHCDYKTQCYVLSRILETSAYFDALSAPNSYRITCSSNGWTETIYQLEVKTNRVTAISKESTDAQYPSAKAVYNFVQDSKDVFEATYNVTTYEEIVAAVKAKKHVICFYNDRVYNLCNYQEERDIFFTCAISAIYTIQCLVSGEWRQSQYNYEMPNNKVTSLSSASTNTQYPSAKAVYDFVQNSITNVLNEEV